MKVKFDENLDARLVAPLRDNGHEVDTVRDQGLLGVADQELYDHCVQEQLVLVSLDKDFSSILRYPPGSSGGIVILRGPDNLFDTMRRLVTTLVEALRKDTPVGKLWIVELGRLRVYEPGLSSEG